MDFDFSDEQKALKDHIRRILAAECPFAVPRGALNGDDRAWRGVWRALADAGLLGSIIPEDLGGAGAGYLELCLVAEELGRALAPTPFLSSAYFFTELLLRCGSDDQIRSLAPDLACGKLVGCVAFPHMLQIAGNESFRIENERIFGTLTPILDGDLADILIVPRRCSERQGTELWLVHMDRCVSRTKVITIDPTRGHATIEFAGATVERLDGDKSAIDTFYTTLAGACILTAFEQVGGADRALEMACHYARERMAFGRPIGSFQALKHMMADMYVSATLARSNAYYGAWALSAGSEERLEAAAIARISATDAFHLCARNNIQVHGGMGFTWEADCHLFYRRAHFLGIAFGGISYWAPRLVQRLSQNSSMTKVETP